MGKLDEYKNKNPQAFVNKSQSANNAQRQVLNMLVKIESYEIGGSLESNYVIGKRIDTKEQVKIRLFEIDQTNNRYKRVEISEFADPKNKKRHVPVGCYLVFESARTEPDGSFTARWCVVLDRDPQATKAIVMPCSLTHGINKENQLEWFQIRALHPVQPKVVSSIEDFEKSLSDMLKPNYPGSNPRVYIRITDDENDKDVFEIHPLKVEVEEDGSKFKRVVADTSKSVENFKETEKDLFKMISDLILDQDIKVELIPLSVLYPGAATKEKLESQHVNTKKHLIESFYVLSDENGEQEDGQEGEGDNPSEQKPMYPEVGYHFCVIATRMYPDGTPYLTYIKPLLEHTKAISIKEMETFSLKK